VEKTGFNPVWGPPSLLPDEFAKISPLVKAVGMCSRSFDFSSCGGLYCTEQDLCFTRLQSV